MLSPFCQGSSRHISQREASLGGLVESMECLLEGRGSCGLVLAQDASGLEGSGGSRLVVQPWVRGQVLKSETMLCLHC